MQQIFKIALLGNRAMSISIGEMLNDDLRAELLVILNPDDDGIDRGNALSLKKRAQNWSCQVEQPAGLRKPEDIKLIADFSPDLILSCSYAKIIPAEVIDLSKIHSLNIHFADLPRNRGCLPVVWTMAQQEQFLSATLHKIFPGIDDGDIVLKKQMPLLEGITAQQATMQCVELGVEAFTQYWQELKAGNVMPASAQDEKLVTYHSMKFPYDRYVPWGATAAQIAAVINSLTFPPHPAARSLFSSKSKVSGEWNIVGPAVVTSAPAKDMSPGTISIVKSGGFIVACGDGKAIHCQKILPNDDPSDTEDLRTRLNTGQFLQFEAQERPIYQP